MREILISTIVILVFLLTFEVGQKPANADEVTWATYLDALESGELVDIPALSQGDKQPLDGLLFVPEGAGPFSGNGCAAWGWRNISLPSVVGATDSEYGRRGFVSGQLLHTWLFVRALYRR